MSNLDLLLLILLVAGVGLAGFGLMGLWKNEVVINRYRVKTRYTGHKAIAVSCAWLVFGASFIFISAVMLTGLTPQTADLVRLGFVVGIGGFIACWVLSWLVSGTVERDSTGSW